MDLLSRVGKGVVGVGKAAGQGVVGVGKGVGQGVGMVGKTATQGVTSVGKGVATGVTTVATGVTTGVTTVATGVTTGVTTVATGVTTGVTTVGKGVTTGVTTVATGVTTGVTTVGKGVGQVGKAAGQGVVSAGTVVGKTAVGAANAGVNAATTAGMAGVSVAGAVGGTAVHIVGTAVDASGTAVRQISGQRVNSGPRPAATNIMEIFCNEFYTQEFVLGEIEKARNDKKITTIRFEDLILRQSPEIAEAATKLLADTAASFQAMTDESGKMNASRKMDSSSTRGTSTRTSASSRTPAKKGKNPQGEIHRTWDGVLFTESISCATDYALCRQEREEFQRELMGLEQIRSNVPIRFTTRIELHTMMGGEDVKELLKEIELDETITGVDFPGLTSNHNKLPSAFMQNFDSTTGEWKEDAMSIEIQLRYAGYDNMGFSMIEENRAFDKQRKLPRKVITRCIQRLEGGPDDTLDISRNSERGARRSRKSSLSPDLPSNSVKGASPKRKSRNAASKKHDSEGSTDLPRHSDRGAIPKRSSRSPKKILSEGGPSTRSTRGPRKCVSEGVPNSKHRSDGTLKKRVSEKEPVTGSTSPMSDPKKRESKTSVLDESFSWAADNEEEEKPLVDLTKPESKTRKSGLSEPSIVECA